MMKLEMENGISKEVFLEYIKEFEMEIERLKYEYECLSMEIKK